MHRLSRIFATLSVAAVLASCDAPLSSGDFATSESGLSLGPCSSVHPARTADVTLVGGLCTRYYLDATGGPWFFPNSGPVASVFTSFNAAAWVCATAQPAGFTQSPWAPCWSTGVTNSFQRVRGAPMNNASSPYAVLDYLPASRNVSGQSFVLSRGILPGPPACPYTQGAALPPTHWHSCTTRSDSGLQDWYSNNDPGDGNFCCNTSANWPSGLAGAPCQDHEGATGTGIYAVENYGGCPVY